MDDTQARNQLVQNLLVMIGIATAAEMSNAGRMVLLDGLKQIMNYLMAPTEAEVIDNVAPIYQ